MSDSMQHQPVARPRTTHPSVYEVPEFMVRKLDGHIHPALVATPGSGVVYTESQQWTPEPSLIDPIDFDEIYANCIQAQSALITEANRLCTKKKIPSLDITVAHSWSEVDQSVSDACKSLETLSSKDKSLAPGFTGKLKKAFRSLCSNAGAGTTLTNLVPTESYGSVLCGGLRIILKALEETDRYREEVYNALEELPVILNDNAALVGLHHSDEELHRRIASVYTAIYRLLEVIVGWFLKPSFVTGAKMFANPSGFSDKLKNRLATVKVAAQRLTSRAAIISSQKQEAWAQQGISIMCNQDQTLKDMMREIGHVKVSQLMFLEKMTQFLDNQARDELHKQSLPKRAAPRIEAPGIDVEDLLDKYLYQDDLVQQDCAAVLRLQHIPGYDIDRDLVSTIKYHPRFQSWLTINESSVLLVDTRSENPTGGLEMPIVAAETFCNLHAFIEEQEHQGLANTPRIMCLIFFCSQHKDFARDANGSPTELVMSLLFQLIDHYGDFDSDALELVDNRLDPEDVDTALSVFEALLTRLPEDVFLVLMIDDLKAFTQPVSRKHGLFHVIERLLAIHRDADHGVKLKFLFGNSARNDFSNGFFTEDETLRIWSPSFGSYAY
ncbi:hypothetical protein F66182_1569 [Fusarium sp. NRRL 66182]|nr:hypothetical protein F66182_1569 [Fusarium sp. NRRL 66182]